MKIDVEGAELQVLAGASVVLRNYRNIPSPACGGGLGWGRIPHVHAKHAPISSLPPLGPEQERQCIAFLDAIGYRLTYLNGREAGDRPLHSDEIVALQPGFDGSVVAAAKEA